MPLPEGRYAVKLSENDPFVPEGWPIEVIPLAEEFAGQDAAVNDAGEETAPSIPARDRQELAGVLRAMDFTPEHAGKFQEMTHAEIEAARLALADAYREARQRHDALVLEHEKLGLIERHEVTAEYLRMLQDGSWKGRISAASTREELDRLTLGLQSASEHL